MSKLATFLLTLAFATSIALTAVFAEGKDDEEKQVRFKDLPAPVQKTVKAKFAQADILKCEVQREEGKTVYEVKVMTDDGKLELEFNARGRLLEQQSDIALRDLPKAVKKAIKTTLPGARPVKAEKHIARGKTFYEVKFACGRVLLEVTFAPSGRVQKIEVEGIMKGKSAATSEGDEDDDDDDEGDDDHGDDGDHDHGDDDHDDGGDDDDDDGEDD